ncbi:hypothetical protein Ahy_B10g104225 [Arachis hypogaea]|uniref:Uncharacterized protein n=1 Tax=Arachis hypogaea TaxID=3818 RepID=A0A444X4Z3_ARAHY|nr:hypothetical protein Ahy_B10g104225 [Arachis hypogaea]
MSLEEESVSDPAQQKMIVVRMETHSESEPLDITPQPQKLDESTPTVPPAPSKVNLAPEATAALMMMANTASYVPKEFLMPSFSLDFTYSSQEEILTQEGQPGSQKGKSPKTPILIEQLEELVEKIANNGVKAAMNFAESKSPLIEKQPSGQIFENFETPATSKEMSGDMREKCYLWATCVKTYADGSTNEYDPVCTLNTLEPILLSKVHFASLKASSYIESEVILEYD